MKKQKIPLCINSFKIPKIPLCINSFKIPKIPLCINSFKILYKNRRKNQIDTFNTQIHDHSCFWLGTGTSI